MLAYITLCAFSISFHTKTSKNGLCLEQIYQIYCRCLD